MRTLARYALLQVPGVVIAALVVAGLWYAAELSGEVAIGLLLLWIAKDIAFYPLLRRSYEGHAPTGAERLIGARGIARQPLGPRGYVAVGGELWQAEIAPGSHPIAAGAAVRVTAARRLRLIVIADEVQSATPCTGGTRAVAERSES